MILLTPKLVERVIREEAHKHRVSFSEVLNVGMREPARLARRAAMVRITAMTDCRPFELAKAWGCESDTVKVALGAEAPPRSQYDAETIDRLRWAHGDFRTKQILAGQCPMTRNDLAAWRRLGARAEA